MGAARHVQRTHCLPFLCLKRAIEIGDPTAREAAEKYSEDPDIWKKLVVTSVTYHDK